jgi:heme/copper-type cytochrome/quinol oxidase subunit 3
MGFWILGVFLWILLALWPARVAASKGRSFLVWFIISIFFWFITLFAAYMIDDRSKAAEPA